ncbi:carbohydrate ABC transporter permease [Martelella mangrovi]|uniref:Oligogalacturonide transport system permease protein n=1 Tax=Martelella mangrovi TaxID=1397477 RepID=A0ABV2IDE3_9HYPH
MYESKRLGYLFVLPFILGILSFNLFPFVASFALSFTDYPLIGSPTYTGLENYQEMFFDDELFWQSLFVTVAFTFVVVPLRLVVALFMAQVLNFKLRGINFFRAAYYMPTILGGSIAISILWQYLFQTHGLVNLILSVVGIEPIQWLASEHYAIWTIVLLNVWQFGAAMVIFLAALQGVPVSLYEAAEVDGASMWRKFWNVTVPLITPVIFFNMIMQIVNCFQEFNAPYMITNGGPMYSTYVMAMYIYEEAFEYFNMGYASALSWVLFLVIVLLAGLLFWSSSYWVFYSGEKERTK